MATKTQPAPPTLFEAIHHICAGKGLDREAVMQIISESLLGAYRKKYGAAENVEVIFDKDANDVVLIAKRKVVAKVSDPALEVTVEQAAKAGVADAPLGAEIEIRETPATFSRIATVTAKHLVLQKLREVESQNIYDEYKDRVGELVHGQFMWAQRDTLFIDLGKVEAIMPRRHQMPTERYRQGDRVKAIIHAVEFDPKRPKITLSRTSPEFVKKLFELEIPEIYEGIVRIVTIARQAGIRSKVVVASNRSDVDPVGACVGMRGVRIQSIVRELGNERIDIVQYTTEIEELITSAMSPATVQRIRIDPVNMEAICIVRDDELSLAIGKDGSNVKLASQVSGYRIDLKTETQYRAVAASPEARAKLDALFTAAPAEDEGAEEEAEAAPTDYTPLSEIPGLTKRVIAILESGNVRSVEDLVALNPEELTKIDGMTRSTADQIYRLLAEVIEFEEEAEAESEPAE